MNKIDIDRIIKTAIDYINGGYSKTFGQVALELYDLHREMNPVYAKYDKGPLTDWREIPLMPISEFKKGNVGIDLSDFIPFPGVEFLSSGTTQRDKSKHRMYDTEAYRASIAKNFFETVTYTSVPSYRVILLTSELENNSLYYMMCYVSELHDVNGIRELFPHLKDPEKVKLLLESLKEEETDVILFGTSLAFYDLMETIENIGAEAIQLSDCSLVIETGGWKGRDIKMTPDELTTKVQQFFDINNSEDSCMLREYSMSELSSQLWSWDRPESRYYAPRWLNYRLVDPLSQTEVERGETGIIAFVDLANVWSCPFILTEDMGHLYTDGELVLEGRAPNAPEKGCSLTYVASMDS